MAIIVKRVKHLDTQVAAGRGLFAVQLSQNVDLQPSSFPVLKTIDAITLCHVDNLILLDIKLKSCFTNMVLYFRITLWIFLMIFKAT